MGIVYITRGCSRVLKKFVDVTGKVEVWGIGRCGLVVFSWRDSLVGREVWWSEI